MRPAVCPALALGNFFKISLFATRDVPDSKLAGYRIPVFGKSNLPDIRQGAAAWWLPTTDLYNNVVLRYFLKMLFAENPEKIFAFALLSLFKKSYRNS